jgi:hypothetical protein
VRPLRARVLGLTEVRSGRRSTDVLVDRLLSAIGGTSSIYAPLTIETAN